MKVSSAEFWASATKPVAIPPARHPEVALAGRSNVGKSSLLNRLVSRRSLARTSRTPGCTRGLLFYSINDSISLVDLPGYGYASRSHAEREGWRTLVEHYLQSREELAGVLILIDLRRGPESEEEALVEYLDGIGVAHAWVATKADKLRRGKRAQAAAALRKRLHPAPLIETSSVTGDGIQDLWRWMQAAVAAEPDLGQQE